MIGAPLIYVDETTFLRINGIRYCWQPVTSHLDLPMNQERGHSITVFGAVSSILKRGFYFETGVSTNKIEF